MSEDESVLSRFPLEGAKLTLHIFSVEHVNDNYIDWLNDPEVVKYSNQRFKPHDANSCHNYLKSFENTENLFLAVHLKEAEEFIGTMTAYYSAPHQVVDLGLMIGNKKYWGRGFGQEAWNLLMSFMLEKSKIRKVTGGTSSSNLGMINIMKRAEMKADGRRIEQELMDGVPADIVYFAKFSNE